jgi:hypothetical protein
MHSETVLCTSPAGRVAVVDRDRVVRREGHGRLVIGQQGADHEVGDEPGGSPDQPRSHLNNPDKLARITPARGAAQ